MDAQFSGPFVIATALATGRMGWDSYRGLGDPAIRALMGRVRCENDPEIEAEFPANMAGKLTVTAKGRVVSKIVIVPKGDPANFPDEEAFRGKFASLAEPVIGADAAGRLADAMMELDRLEQVGVLFGSGVKMAA